MRVALAQINSTVGDIPGNEARILEAYRSGMDSGADLVVFDGCPHWWPWTRAEEVADLLTACWSEA